MTTSLSVAPRRFLIAFTWSSGTEPMAKRRWRVIVLLNGVGGAATRGRRGGRSRCSPWSPRGRRRRTPSMALARSTRRRALATSLIARRLMRLARPGLRVRLTLARRSSSSDDGTLSGSHGATGGSTSLPSGSASSMIVSSSTPDAPSMVAWWTFVRMREVVALEALDDVDLPQRAAAVERTADDAGDLVGELLGVARRREREVPDVEVEVEVRVGDPVGAVEAERYLHHAPAEGLDQVAAGSPAGRRTRDRARSRGRPAARRSRGWRRGRSFGRSPCGGTRRPAH